MTQKGQTNFPASSLSAKNPLLLFTHGQRLQRPLQILLGNIRLLLDGLEGEPVVFVEEHEHTHLVRAHCQDVLASFTAA